MEKSMKNELMKLLMAGLMVSGTALCGADERLSMVRQ